MSHYFRLTFLFFKKELPLVAKFKAIGYLEAMNSKEEMLKRISELESLNDQLMSELRYLNQLLKEVGFEEGLKTLKEAAKEMLDQDRESSA
jgi:hypothetical protein